MAVIVVLICWVFTLCWGLYHLDCIWSSELSSEGGYYITLFQVRERCLKGMNQLSPSNSASKCPHAGTCPVLSITTCEVRPEHGGRQSWFSLPPSPYVPLSLDFLLVKWKRKHTPHRTMVRRKELKKEFLLKRICLSTALPLGRVSRLCQSMRSKLARPLHLHSLCEHVNWFWVCLIHRKYSLLSQSWSIFRVRVVVSAICFGHPVAQRHQNGPTDFLENSQCSVSFQLITSSSDKP